MDKVSIIMTHWGMNMERNELARTSLSSLIETAPNAEIIVVDNGESVDAREMSQWLLNCVQSGDIACYVRNRKNMHFGYARNQGLALASGAYLVITDNDVLFEDGWMEACVDFLKRNEGNYLATPIKADPMNARAVRWRGEVDGWGLNTRAGSNVFMMRRQDYETIGNFEQHHIAGSHYCDRCNSLGYLMAVMPRPRAIDMGLRRGYNIKKKLETFEL